MQEKVGKVVLDLSHYSGEDFYCDGDVEDRLLEIVKEYKKEDWPEVIEKEKSWPVLYHLSSLRTNVVSWIPMKEGSKVLEIGSGCGAITGALADKKVRLTCVDLSKKRSLINAYRNQEKENITIAVGNFQDIEPDLDNDFDYIYLIGVFEYAMAYIGGENPYTEFLNIVKKHLAPGGKIVIAIENQLGLKYFAGCREDHLGDYFSGLEDYPKGGVVRTFARNRLEQICKECEISEYHFYYPYPDYKFMTTLFSDERLPRVGELTNNLRNFDRDRLLLFDETKVFDSIIREGVFPYFSNSYLLLIGEGEEVVYSKYSNDRDGAFSIRTDMKKSADGTRRVEKIAAGKEAGAHLATIYRSGERLSKRFEGSGLKVCPVQKEGENLVFPYLEGETLEEMLDKELQKEGGGNFCLLLKQYREVVSYREDAGVTDYDLIFPNLLIDSQGTWQLIDYEWTYETVILAEKIAKRALYCYFLGSGRKEAVTEKIGLQKVLDALGITDWEEDALREEETKFQMKVTGNHLSLSQMRDEIHQEVLPIMDAVTIYQNKKAKEKAQIYIDKGEGFSEEHSYFVMPERLDENVYRLRLKVDNEVKKLRFDPGMDPCVITIKEMTYQGENVNQKQLLHNGSPVGENTFVFPHRDPNFTWEMEKAKEAAVLEITYEMVRVSETMAKAMGEKKERLFYRGKFLKR